MSAIWATIEAAYATYPWGTLGMLIVGFFIAGGLLTATGLFAEKLVSRTRVAMRVRFRRTFGFWPAPKRRSIFRKVQQRRIDTVLHDRAQGLNYAYLYQHKLDKVYSDTTKEWTPKQLKEADRQLAEVRKRVKRLQKSFWRNGYRVAERFGYRVKPSYKNYL